MCVLSPGAIERDKTCSRNQLRSKLSATELTIVCGLQRFRDLCSPQPG